MKQNDSLHESFSYYLAHQSELVPIYKDKVLVIVGKQVVGAYDNEADAYFAALKKYEPGSFLIQLCTEGESAYTQVFHSNNVAFV